MLCAICPGYVLSAWMMCNASFRLLQQLTIVLTKITIMLRKRVLYFFASALFCSFCSAQVKHKLVVQTVDEQTEEYKLEDIRKITFSDEFMNITPWNSVRSDSYLFETIVRMYFVDDTSGLTYAGGDSPYTFAMSQSGQTVSVSGMEQPLDMYLFDTAGVLHGKVRNWDGQQYSISSLPAGTYVMVVGSQPFKFVKPAN